MRTVLSDDGHQRSRCREGIEEKEEKGKMFPMFV
jgi:hypothetical protein